MRRLLALTWLVIVIAAGCYFVVAASNNVVLQSDLLALLPQEERNPAVQLANEAVSRKLGHRILLAFGDADRERARTAAQKATATIEATGLADVLNSASFEEVGRKMAIFYFPYASTGGLLSPADRTVLEEGHADQIANRAMAQAFGFGSPVDAKLLSTDPFLLLPSFLSSLPTPLGRLSLDDGLLTVLDGDTTWVFVPITLRHETFDLEMQQQLVTAIDGAIDQATKTAPDLKTLRLGTLFFANYGARTAIDEASTLTSISIAGTILLIVCVFRRLSPLLLNLLAVLTGITVAFAGTLAIFGGIHVAALLFGTSLIGVVVDYGLLYSVLAFAKTPATGPQRLAYILPSISLGLATTLMGYAALAFAPFPGLKQIAVFAIIGIFGAFATVVLWFPILDHLAPLRHGSAMLRMALLPWTFWTAEKYRTSRRIILANLVGILAIGLAFYRTNDDVRRLQTLSPELQRHQIEVQRLLGTSTVSQYLLITSPDDQAVLRQEEAIAPILDHLVADHAIAGYQMPSMFVPSLRRQATNRALVENRLLTPHLTEHMKRLGLATAGKIALPTATIPLTVESAVAGGAFPFLPDLIISPGLHIVALQGLTRADALEAAFAGQSNVRFVNPTADFSRLLGAYRERAVILTIISLGLVACLLTWRYGFQGAFWATLPPAIAGLLVPAVISLIGEPFTFFHAMGLVLIIGIGADYTIFCAETSEGKQSVTMLSISLAAATTLLSFGLLGLSGTLAVRSFGLAMLIGVTAAYALAPLAARPMRRSTLSVTLPSALDPRAIR
jgi:predicted exporter